MSRAWVLLIAVMASFCGLARPDVRITPGNYFTTTIGSSRTMTCTISGETFLGWFDTKGNKITATSSSASIYVEASGSDYLIHFSKLELSHAGDYECRGSSNKERLSVYVHSNTNDIDKTQHIRIGQTDTIKLGFYGSPKVSFTWKKGDKELNPSSDSRLTLLADGSLKISKVTKSDNGTYTCKLAQRFSGFTGTAKIDVYAVELPKIKPFSMPRRFLTEGYPATFLCEATGFPAPKYKWISPKNVQINPISNIKVEGGNLTFTSVPSNLDIGKYTCKAYIEIEETKEQIGETSAAVEVVAIYVAPYINPVQGSTVNKKKDDDYELKCVATGNPAPDVTWTRNGVKDPRQRQTKGQSLIYFAKIQPSDGGVYTCEAQNSAVDNQGNTIIKRLNKTVNVESPPYIDDTASPREVYSYIGNSDATWIRCKYYGYPAPFVSMRFENRLLHNATEVAEVRLITDAKKFFGSYKCHAKNYFGTSNYTVELKQAEAPSGIRNLQGDPTCNSITLQWLEPEKDGGMPISKYVLNFEGSYRNIDGDETSYTISDLKHNTEYSLTLRATNKAEWGPISNLKVKTKEYCAPGRPIIYSPTSTLLTKDSVTLRWRRPAETGGDDDITYTVRYRVEKGETKGPWKTLTTRGLEMEITDLDNQVQYKFEVFAENKGGKGLPDERYIQTNYPGKRSAQVSLMSSAFLTIFVGGILLVL